MKFIIAKKIGMTTLYSEGLAENVTLLDASRNVVTGVRTKEKDGYLAVVVGIVKKENDKQKGKSKKNSHEIVKEFRVENEVDTQEFEKGKELGVDQFAKGEKVKIRAKSKGKGFQGVMKRHGFKGGPASHGHRHDHRAPGSIGSAFPQRVVKGKRMAGRMGGDMVTVRNMKVAYVDKDQQLIALEGSVPGNRGSVVTIIAAK